MNLTVRVCDNGCGETVEILVVCAVTELRSTEDDVILPVDVVCKLKVTPCTVSASCADVSVVRGEWFGIPKVVTEEGTTEDVCSVPVTNVEFCVSGGDGDEVCDVKVEVDSVVNGEDNPEEVDKSVVGIGVCVIGCDVGNDEVVKIVTNMMSDAFLAFFYIFTNVYYNYA